MQVIRRLALSACGMHTADQIAITAVPLVAAVAFEASAEVIGILVAAQALAHLLGSIPSGLVVDRTQPRRGAIAAATISATGFAGVAVSIHLQSLIWFGLSVSVAGFGVVLFVLVALSTIPLVSTAGDIAAANSSVEIARAVPTLAVPIAIGLLVDAGLAAGIFALAAASSAGALILAPGIPEFEVPPRETEPVLQTILKGARFIAGEPLLRAIAICAIFWNLAFSALLAILATLLLSTYGAPLSAFGIALSAFGGAMIAGTWTAGKVSRWLPPGVILIFGPGSSFVAILALFAMPADGPVGIIYVIFFALGFGPSMWMVAQNAIRQLVTPRPVLGCVNAVIQTAIYGIRPLGALAGGFVAGAVSPGAGVIFVTVAFGLSLAAAVFSPLRSVRSFAGLQGGSALVDAET